MRLHSISFWWKGMALPDSKKVDPLNWFETWFIKKVGWVFKHTFWEVPWIGTILNKIRFHRLYTISQIQDGFVGEIERWEEGRIC